MSHHFISFDSADKQFAFELSRQLEKGSPKLSFWITELHRANSTDIREEVREAIDTCKSFILVISAQLKNENSRCHWEWKKAISYKKPVQLVFFQRDGFVPGKLESRRRYDIYKGIEADIDKLKQTLHLIESNENTLITLREYLADAMFDIEYVTDDIGRQTIQKDIESLKAQIVALQNGIQNPAEIEHRIKLGIQREKNAMVQASIRGNVKFINDPPTLAPVYFQDRHLETSLLTGFVKSASEKICVIDGRGGVGKTSMVCRFLKSLEKGEVPDSDERLTVDGIIYMNAIGSHQINFADILSHSSQLIDDFDRQNVVDFFNDSSYTIEAKTIKLLEAIRGKTIILLLDNFEDELTGTGNQIGKTELIGFFEAFVNYPAVSLKVLITTRYMPSNLAELPPDKIRSISLEGGLQSPYGELALREMDADGHARLKYADDLTLRGITEFTRGFPRALEAFFTILRADRNTTVSDILQKQYPADKITMVLVGEAYSRLPLADQRVIEALAVFGFPVSAVAVDYVLNSFALQVDSAPTLRRLVNMHFVRKEGQEYFLHPLDREFALNRIPKDTSGNEQLMDNEPTLKLLLLRAASFLVQLRKPTTQWTTIKDIEPQLREFELRIQAGDNYWAESLLEDLSRFLDSHGGFFQKLQMAEQLEKCSDDPETIRVALENLFESYFRIGNIKKAIEIEEKLIKFLEENGGSHSQLFYAKSNLMVIKIRGGVPEEQLLDFQNYVDLPENQPYINIKNKSVLYQHMAFGYQALEYYFEALELQQKSYNLIAGLNDINLLDGQTHNLASCYEDLGEVEKAKELYHKAILLSEQSYNPLWKANHLSSLSNCYRREGYIEKAVELINAAIALRKEIKDLGGQCADFIGLARIHFDNNCYQDAIAWTELSISFAKDLGEQLAGRYRLLALIYLMENRYHEGLEAIESALEEKSVRSKYDSKLLKGIFLYRLGNKKSAKLYFDDCVTSSTIFFERCGVNSAAGDARALSLLGSQLSSNGDVSHAVVDMAISLYQKTHEVSPYKTDINLRLNLFNKLTETTTNRELDKAVFWNVITGSTQTTTHPTIVDDGIPLKPPKYNRKKVLFISSSPRNMTTPNVEEQYEAIKKARNKGKFKLERQGLVAPEDLLNVIIDCNPDIVHFFMHNSKERGLYFENDQKRIVTISGLTLGKIIAKAQETCNIECLVMNCCNSETLLDNLKPFVRNIIYARDYVPDDKESVATLFAEKFYEAVASGRSYAEALDKTKIELEAASPILPQENKLLVGELFEIYCSKNNAL
jgi:tetratricopeptide (TPR) repeat protein